jgi:hypothetical protein
MRQAMRVKFIDRFTPLRHSHGLVGRSALRAAENRYDAVEICWTYTIRSLRGGSKPERTFSNISGGCYLGKIWRKLKVQQTAAATDRNLVDIRHLFGQTSSCKVRSVLLAYSNRDCDLI